MVSDPPSKRCLLRKNKHIGNDNILGFGFVGFFNLSQKKGKEQMKCYGEPSLQCISPSPTQGEKVKLSRFYMTPAEDLWLAKKPRMIIVFSENHSLTELLPTVFMGQGFTSRSWA